MDENKNPSELYGQNRPDNTSAQQQDFTPASSPAPSSPQPTHPPAITPSPQRTGYTVTSAGGFYSSGGTTSSTPYRSYSPQITPSPRHNAPTPPTPSGKEPKRFSLLTVLVAVVLAAVIGAGSAVAAFSALMPSSSDGYGLSKKENSSSDVASGSGGDITIDVSDVDTTIGMAVAEKVTPSVVGIRTTVMYSGYFGEEEASGEGSGVIYTEDGYIITNYHVIKEAVEYVAEEDAIQVFLSDDPEKGYPATVVGYNISNDLAVIKIAGKDLPTIEWADSSELKVGQYCMAVGNPGGLQFMGSATWGIVSGLNRVLSDSGSTGTQLIQTDAAINPGNSGGALVNIEGKLVGINSSKLVSESVEGMGFAIPSNTTKEICDKIIAKEDDPDPYIGVTISQYDAQTLQQYGYPAGAWIYSVVKGGPAHEAGIQRGDIITEFDGVEITDYTVLLDAIADSSPDEEIKVRVFRTNTEKYVTLRLTVGSNNSY